MMLTAATPPARVTPVPVSSPTVLAGGIAPVLPNELVVYCSRLWPCASDQGLTSFMALWFAPDDARNVVIRIPAAAANMPAGELTAALSWFLTNSKTTAASWGRPLLLVSQNSIGIELYRRFTQPRRGGLGPLAAFHACVMQLGGPDRVLFFHCRDQVPAGVSNANALAADAARE